LARKILLADDSVTAQNMGRKILADAGYDVVTVNNGSAALKRIAELKPDLIVLDVYMPGYSGLEVCQRLKDAPETAHIPVLLTVGKLEPFKAEEARRVRADSHIVKPFEASELLTAINRLEDRIVMHSEGGRFAGGSTKTAEVAEPDTSWKSRLSFSSKKKKPEKHDDEDQDPAFDQVSSGSAFRDFRKAKGKSTVTASATAKAPASSSQQSSPVPEIPRDITPEELDALSAFASKINGNPAAGLAPKPELEVSAPEPQEFESSARLIEAAPAPPAVEAIAAESKSIEEKSEVEIPVECVELATEVAAAAVETPSVEAHAADTQPDAQCQPGIETRVETSFETNGDTNVDKTVDTTGGININNDQVQSAEISAIEVQLVAAEVTPVNTALLAEAPAPVDSNDEPLFAQYASLIEQTPEEQTLTSVAVENVADNSAGNSAENFEEKTLEGEKPFEDVTAATPNFTATGEHTEAQESASVGELAEVSGQAEFVSATAPEASATEPHGAEAQTHETVSANISETEIQSEEAKLHGAPQAAPHTHMREAEEAAPTDDELVEALRLLTPATAYSFGSTVPSHEALAAAGQLLAEEAVRNAASGPRWVAESVLLTPEEAVISLEAEMMLTLTSAPAVAAREFNPEEIGEVSAITAAVENRLAEAGLGTSAMAHHVVSNPQRESGYGRDEPGEADAVDSPSATFADAMGGDDAEQGHDASSDSGGLESMGRKAKSGKSHGEQIHHEPAAAVAHDEAAQQSKTKDKDIAAPQKAMAAAAAESSSSSSISATDASTIASIVDSVMADLRPRIVEEIARKLAGK
jgi:CheY-like chemotaxis protein